MSFDIINYLEQECLKTKSKCPICLEKMNVMTIASLHSNDKEGDVHQACKKCFYKHIKKDKRCFICRNENYVVIIMDRRNGILHIPTFRENMLHLFC